MKKAFFLILTTFFFNGLHSQSSPQWRGYFSYNTVRGLGESPGRIFAAAENTYFSKNLSTNEILKTNTIDGLSGQIISAFYHSSQYNQTLVGYPDGFINVTNEADRSIRQVVDIRNKPGIAPNLKRINHFYEYQNNIYISCDFGIVVYNIQTGKFGDTYFIGPSGENTEVLQTVVVDDYLYAVTRNNGIRRGDLTNPNLINFNFWETFDAGNWTGIASIDEEIVAVNVDNRVYRHNGFAFTAVFTMTLPAVDIRANVDYLTVTTPSYIYVFNSQLVIQNQIANFLLPDFNSGFYAATVLNNIVYAGTETKGLIAIPLGNSSSYTSQTPDGPQRNDVFRIRATTNALWAVFGEYTDEYNPYPLDSRGISRFSDNTWLNIPYESVLEAKSLSYITVHPNNEQEVYVSSFYSGLLKLQENQVVTIFNTSNSGLESIPGQSFPDIRIGATAFDRNGNLWVSNSRINRLLKYKKPDGTWQSVNMENIIPAAPNNSITALLIDKNGTKWMATTHEGVVAYNENGNIFRRIVSSTEQGFLPDRNVRSLAIDNRNQLWIGTRRGLRVLPSIDRFLNDQSLSVNPIIIIEDDLPQELFFQQVITAIKVDGANNKWVGTAGAGVFMVSPNGQQTFHHFTEINSPLPSNSIRDIDINGVTGEVFIATDRGMVSFKGIATDAADNLQNVIVYPNPVRPGYEGTVKITGLMDRVNIKITDIEGNLVHEATSEGGTIEWDTRAFGKYKVASGVYMIFLASEDAADTKVKKLMIVR